MLLQVNCRGFAIAEHMQPEPSKYSHAPNLEQRTFMQPEQPLYAHHPGRFVYVSDVDSGELFSIPYDPVRQPADSFVFSAGKADIEWRLENSGIETRLSVALPVDDVAELWTLRVKNAGDKVRRLRLFPYFTIGYMSWMNQSARYREDLGGIVASSVTPYQKLEDYTHVKQLKDLTVLLHDTAPDGWEACRDAFEGHGGIHYPDAIATGGLANGAAIYETPVAVLQYTVALQPDEAREYRFVFAPARTDEDIRSLRERYLAGGGFEAAYQAYAEFLADGEGCLKIESPDEGLNNFVNHWLDRQVFFHGDANRLTTDPQTRNFLQDNMGMVYVEPRKARCAIKRALSQQKADGAMPEGIILNHGTTLKYINEIPHTDHCVWIAIALQAYLDETGDVSILDERIAITGDEETRSIFERATYAMRWLIANRDARGLSLIAQGDWCDPMNMVGPDGKGVSGWLTVATVYALRTWASVSRLYDEEQIAREMEVAADEFSAAAQKHLWDGNWFARGITDDGKSFGVSADEEGSIYLNPQSWALLSGIATPDQQCRIIAAVRDRLSTPYGTMLLAPPYTAMREDIGRVTQKHPGTGENGSIYNHASTFYIDALYVLGERDGAYAELRKMIPGPSDEDYTQRGQLPVFVPNYYRGAVNEYPRTAGRSSQLFNTGAASWLYRILIERLFGLRGHVDGLLIDPQLPSEWSAARAIRRFRGATFHVDYHRDDTVGAIRVSVDREPLEDNIIRDIETGRQYTIDVLLPGDSIA